MHKVKILAWIIAALLVAIIIFSGLSAIAGTGDLPEAGIELFVEKGNIWTKGANESEFKEILVQAKLAPGDTVKTDGESQARVVFFDSQEMILHENTELIITEGLIDQQNPFLTKVKVNLIKGQIWSRLLELLHPDATFEVESGSIVATVRGTSFNFKKNEISAVVSVFQGRVAVRLMENEQSLVEVNPGQMFTYDFTAKKHTVEKMTNRKLENRNKDDRWILENFLRDKDFEATLNSARGQLLKNVGALPNARLYRVKQWLEKVSYRLMKKDSVLADHTAKRAIEASAMFDQDVRFGLRLVETNDLVKDFNFLRLQSMSPDFRQLLARQPAARAYFYDNVFTAEQKAFVQKKVEVKSDYTEKESASEINEIWSGELEADAKPTAPTAVDAAKVDEPLKSAPTTNDSAATKPISSPTPTVTPTPMVAPTPAAPVIKLEPLKPKVVDLKQTTNDNNVIIVPATPSDLTITASQTNLSAGDKVVLTAYLVYSDKTKKDVTTEATWSLGADDVTGRPAGVLTRNVFTANDEGGKAFITATYRTADGKSFTGKITLTVLVLQ